MGPEMNDISLTLDPDQREAVTFGNGRLAIRSGAGTGKTTTLVERVKELRRRGVPARYIVLSTFSKKAAGEIRERLASALGDEAYQVRIGTFHALAARLLRRYATYVGLVNERFTIIDEDDSKVLVDLAVTETGAFGEFEEPERPDLIDEKAHAAARKSALKVYEKERKEFVEECATAIARWKTAGLSVDGILVKDRPQRSANEEAMADVYVAYQSELERRNAVDFGDLVMKAVKLLSENPEIRRKVAGTVHHLLVDEAQDMNRIQARFVLQLSSVHGNWAVVGDEDQSICAFQGACLDVFLWFIQHADKVVDLKTNRRCTEEMLAPANLLVDLNPRSGPKELSSGRHGPDLTVSAHNNEFAEGFYIAGKINSLLARGVEPRDIACLVRTSRSGTGVEQAFVKQVIPYTVVGGISLLKREEVKDAVAYMRLAQNPYDDLAFRRVANKPLRGLGPAAINHVCSVAETQGLSFAEACITVANSTVKGVRIRADAKENLGRLAALMEAMTALDSAAEPVSAIFDLALNESGYMAWLAEREDGKKRRKNIQFIRGIADDAMDVCDYLERLTLSEDAEAEDANVVRIMTMHASKGLEFDYVFCPAFEQGTLPHQRSLEEAPLDPNDPWIIGGDGIEGERRLAHVALTRGKEQTHVSFAMKRDRKQAGPSPFLEEAELDIPKPQAQQARAKRKKGKPKNNNWGLKWGAPGWYE